jgi:hypothetical protein
LLSTQLSQLSSHLRRVRKRQIRPFLFQHLDQRQDFRPVRDRQPRQIPSTGAWPRSSAKKSTCHAISYRVSFIRYNCKWFTCRGGVSRPAVRSALFALRMYLRGPSVSPLSFTQSYHLVLAKAGGTPLAG